MANKPNTQKEVINQIWFAIYGTNEHDGILYRLKRLESRPWSIFQALNVVALLVTTVIVLLFGTGILK